MATPPPQEDIRSLALAARASASALISRHTLKPGQKKASIELYEILASCLALCERGATSHSDRAALESLFAQQPPRPGTNRRYVAHNTDLPLIVCRIVFYEDNSTNAWRYATALREAARLGLHSTTLLAHLTTQGGVNALFFPTRSRSSASGGGFATKTLRLSETVTYSRTAPFVLTLQWQEDNTFLVLAGPAGPETHRQEGNP